MYNKILFPFLLLYFFSLLLYAMKIRFHWRLVQQNYISTKRAFLKIKIKIHVSNVNSKIGSDNSKLQLRKWNLLFNWYGSQIQWTPSVHAVFSSSFFSLLNTVHAVFRMNDCIFGGEEVSSLIKKYLYR